MLAEALERGGYDMLDDAEIQDDVTVAVNAMLTHDEVVGVRGARTAFYMCRRLMPWWYAQVQQAGMKFLHMRFEDGWCSCTRVGGDGIHITYMAWRA